MSQEILGVLRAHREAKRNIPMDETHLSDKDTDFVQFCALYAVAAYRDAGHYTEAEALRQARRIQRQTKEMTGTIITDDEITKALSPVQPGTTGLCRKPQEQESDQGAK